MTRERCSATSKQTGKPCRAWAIEGGKVCISHGGRAKQVQAKAAERLLTARIRGELAKAEITPITDPAAAYAADELDAEAIIIYQPKEES